MLAPQVYRRAVSFSYGELFVFVGETYRKQLKDKRKDRGAIPVDFRKLNCMTFNQAAFERQARTVRIVTCLSVRVQEKSKNIHLVAPQRVYIGSTLTLIGMSAMGEIVILIEPP
jgi:hypothetical protein